ncbi:MAG: hypothetical protein WBC92_10585 [Terracidiphilus sp.]
MMLFELFFLAFVFVSIVAAIGGVAAVVRGARRTGKRIFVGLAISWVVYFSVVAIVSATTPQRIIPIGQDGCFDEMCSAVIHAETAGELGPPGQTVKAQGIFYVITMRVSNLSRGRAQREGGLRALLWAAGKSYEVSPDGQSAWETANGATARLTAQLQPGESIESVQVFDLPKDALTPGLVLSHGFTPGYFVIGESPIFRKPTLMRITP